jgi:serpin B
MKHTDDSFNVSLKLPKFSFDYDEENLMTIFKEDLGLKETFGPKPNFEKIADYDMSISGVVHKTFIELGETGTKAAAVTVLTFDDNAIAMDPPEVVEVNFDKPFVYLIKDTDSEEVLFFGVMYSPTKYKEGDVLCEEVDE